MIMFDVDNFNFNIKNVLILHINFKITIKSNKVSLQSGFFFALPFCPRFNFVLLVNGWSQKKNHFSDIKKLLK